MIRNQNPAIFILDANNRHSLYYSLLRIFLTALTFLSVRYGSIALAASLRVLMSSLSSFITDFRNSSRSLYLPAAKTIFGIGSYSVSALVFTAGVLTFFP